MFKMWEISGTVSRILHVFAPTLPHSQTPAFYTDPTDLYATCPRVWKLRRTGVELCPSPAVTEYRRHSGPSGPQSQRSAVAKMTQGKRMG